MIFKDQFFDNDGKPLVGGKLYAYEAGSTTPLNTYTDSDLADANPWPVVLDTAGRASVWLLPQAYLFVMTDAADVPLWTQDNARDFGGILKADLAAFGGAALVEYSAPSAGSALSNLKDRLDEILQGRKDLSFVEGLNVTITDVDDPTNDRRNITIASAPGGSAAMAAETDGGATVGPRSTLNVITGNNAALTIADDPGDDRINLTIAATMAAEKDAGGAVDGRRRINFKTPTFGSVAVADNAGADAIDVTITPDGMKAQKAGGTILGGRAKLNLIEGAGIVLTVADAPADDRINVTIAAAGNILPTIGTHTSVMVSLTDPGSGYPAWGAWATLITSAGYDVIGLIITAQLSIENIDAIQIGTGASPSAILSLPMTTSSDVPFVITPFYVPFSIASGTKISGNGHFTNNGTGKVGITILG